MAVNVDENVQGSELVKGGGKTIVYVCGSVGGKGEGEFDVFSVGILAGGTKVAYKMVNLLEGEVSAL